MKLKSGKHKGREIEDVPQAYLAWLMKNVKLGDAVAKEVARVYYSRELGRPEMTHEDVRAHMEAQIAESIAAIQGLLGTVKPGGGLRF